MKKILSLLALVCLSCMGAWALEPFTFTGWRAAGADWTALTNYRYNMPYYKKQEGVVLTSDGDLTVNFNFTGGNKRMDMYGVDLVNSDGVVVKSDYHHGYTGNEQDHRDYTLSGVEAGTYTIRYWLGRYNDEHLDYTNMTGTSEGTITTSYSGSKTTDFTVTSWNKLTGWTAADIPVPSALSLVYHNTGYGTNSNLYHYTEENVKFYEADVFKVHYQYKSGDWGLNIYGIELLNESNQVVAADYHDGWVGGTPRNPDFSLNVPDAGTYKVRTIVYTGNAISSNSNCDGTVTYTCTSNPYYADQYALDYAVDKNVVRVGCPIYTDEVKNTYSNLNGGKITAENHAAYATALASLSCTLPEDGYYRVKSMKSRYLFDDGANGVSKLNNGATNSKYIYKIDFNQETQKLVSMTNSLGTSATGKADRNAAVVNVVDRDVRFAKDDNVAFRADQLWIAGMNVNTGNGFTINNTAYNTTTNPNFLINWGSSSTANNLKDEGNRWTFEPIEASKIYTIEFVNEVPEDVCVTYNGNGYEGNVTVPVDGFFYFESTPASSDFGVTYGNATITIEGNVIKVTYSTGWADLEAIIAEANTYPYGDHLGQYSNPNFASTKSECEALLANHERGLDAEMQFVIEAIGNLRQEINNLILNMPQPGTFLRLKSHKFGTYLNSATVNWNGNSNLLTLVDGKTGENEKTTIMYLTEDRHLVTYATGMGLCNSIQIKTADSDPYEGNTVLTFSADSKNNVGCYNIKGTYGSTNNYLYGYSDKLARQGTIADECVWELEEVDELPATIATAGFGTFFTPVAVRAAEGVKVYTATVEEGDTPETTTITYTALENGEIPANTAVLVEGEAGTTNMTIINATSNTVSENALIGKVNTEATPTQGEGGKYIYTLTSTGAFKYYTGANLAGFKCHLEIGKDFSGVSASNFRVVFTDGTLTGIDSAIITPANANVYDLLGRRVMNAQRGLYIVNGKKVIR